MLGWLRSTVIAMLHSSSYTDKHQVSRRRPIVGGLLWAFKKWARCYNERRWVFDTHALQYAYVQPGHEGHETLSAKLLQATEWPFKIADWC